MPDQCLCVGRVGEGNGEATRRIQEIKLVLQSRTEASCSGWPGTGCYPKRLTTSVYWPEKPQTAHFSKKPRLQNTTICILPVLQYMFEHISSF